MERVAICGAVVAALLILLLFVWPRGGAETRPDNFGEQPQTIPVGGSSSQLDRDATESVPRVMAMQLSPRSLTGIQCMDRVPQPAFDVLLPFGRKHLAATKFLDVDAVYRRAFLGANAGRGDVQMQLRQRLCNGV